MAEDRNSKGRILVADDDPAILRLVTTILEKEGFSVVGVRDGREAYKALQDDVGFTAAVLDVVLPQISGPELVRFMKTEKRFMKIPVMMMTAEQDPKLSRDSFAAGAVLPMPTFLPLSKIRELVMSALASNFASLFTVPPAVATGIVLVAEGCAVSSV